MTRANGQGNGNGSAPIGLTKKEHEDLVAFLETL